MFEILSYYPGKGLISGCSFQVEIGKLEIQFAKVTNLVSEVEYDAVTEGGNNDYPLLFPKPKTRPDTLILEKGVRTGDYEDIFNELAEGMELENIFIYMVDAYGRIVKYFSIAHGLIIRRKFSDLNAMDGALLIETLEIAHTGLETETY